MVFFRVCIVVGWSGAEIDADLGATFVRGQLLRLERAVDILAHEGKGRGSVSVVAVNVRRKAEGVVPIRFVEVFQIIQRALVIRITLFLPSDRCSQDCSNIGF